MGGKGSSKKKKGNLRGDDCEFWEEKNRDQYHQETEGGEMNGNFWYEGKTRGEKKEEWGLVVVGAKHKSGKTCPGARPSKRGTSRNESPGGEEKRKIGFRLGGRGGSGISEWPNKKSFSSQGEIKRRKNEKPT